MSESNGSHEPAEAGHRSPQSVLAIQTAALTDTGCVRTENEDRISIQESAGIFVVADGMGGESCGGLAADHAILAVEEYLKMLQTEPSSWPYEIEPSLSNSQNAVMNALRLANYRIWEAAQTLPDCHGMGATMSLLQIRDDIATVGNVGDSRVYICRESIFKQLTRDDSVVSNLIDQGQITKEAAKTHPMRNMLTLALGQTEDIPVQLVEFPLRAGDRLLLASDGLHGLVDDDEIERLLRAQEDPQSSVNALVAAALERGGPDNVSCIVIHCR